MVLILTASVLVMVKLLKFHHKWTKFQIKGKISYPVLAETLQSAEKKGMNPCDDFYEFVCSGVKATVDVAISNKKDPGIGTVHLDNEDSQLKFTHNRLNVEQIENFWLGKTFNKKLI